MLARHLRSIQTIHRTCAWGQHVAETEEEKQDEEKAGSDTAEKEPEAPPKKKGEDYDFIVSGAIGNGSESPEVKIWKVENDKVKQIHSLNGHSLGIVSVDVSPNGKCKIPKSSCDSYELHHFFRHCQQLTGLNTLLVER